uniref:Uncharacterized protein n=1 Tax=Elaeophora elaphi TaxID=1147741 RepID=A0A0R3RL52_9BILA
MVWRNDNDRVRRRLPCIPSIPMEAKTFPNLARLNLRNMPSSTLSYDGIERPTRLEIDDESVEQSPISEQSRQFCSSTTIRLTFPMRVKQRRELSMEEDVENDGKL